MMPIAATRVPHKILAVMSRRTSSLELMVSWTRNAKRRQENR
jgi:hypothetical protein